MGFTAPRPKKTKKTKRTYKKKAIVSDTVKTYVKKVIDDNVETKCIQYYNYLRNLVTPIDSATFPTSNIFPLGIDPGSLSIPQGSGQGNRVGNSVTTRKLMFKGTFSCKTYDAILNNPPMPVQIKMWIFYDKRTPIDLPNPLSNFFQNGNTSKGFQSNLVDLWSPVNTDVYSVLATKTYKLGFASYTGSGPSATFQYYSNNDFNLNQNFSIDLTKHYLKTVRFNDATTVPTTRGLFCMITYCNANGSVSIFGTTAVQLQYMLEYQYDDA